MSLWSKIRGTIETIFQIGLGGPQWKNNAGVIEATNPTNTGFVITRGLTPVNPNDYATKNYVDSQVGGGADVLLIRFALGTATASSATSIPLGAIVLDASLDVTTPYSGGATISLGQAGSVTEFQLTTDNNPQANGLYEVVQDTVAASLNPVLATVGGAPAAGAATVLVKYVVTPEA